MSSEDSTPTTAISIDALMEMLQSLPAPMPNRLIMSKPTHTRLVRWHERGFIAKVGQHRVRFGWKGSRRKVVRL